MTIQDVCKQLKQIDRATVSLAASLITSFAFKQAIFTANKFEQCNMTINKKL